MSSTVTFFSKRCLVCNELVALQIHKVTCTGARETVPMGMPQSMGCYLAEVMLRQ